MMNKIKSREEIVKLIDNLKSQGKIIGFTSGVFDIIHAGHIDYLEVAHRSCDILILGINSDESTKISKGPNRPINSQYNRAKVLSALSTVDYIFIFNEQNNHANIELLKPNIYFKGGDYDLSKLTSKNIVESYGGKVEIIPIKENTSTSNIIARLSSVELPLIKNEKLKVAFLDRDGTINEDPGYLHEPDKFVFTDGALEGLKKMQDLGYRLIIVTMQSGIGLGYFSKEDFYKLNSHMFKQLSPHGINIDKIYFCPHSISDNCNCRKPKTGLIKRAMEDYDNLIDIKNSYFIGDKTSDIKCGKDFGLKTILVRTGKAGRDNEHEIEPDHTVDNLLKAAEVMSKV